MMQWIKMLPFAFAASYRVWGRATGREGSDEFTLHEMKQAWRSGAWYR